MNKDCVFFILPEQVANFQEIEIPESYGQTSSIYTSFASRTIEETLKRRLPINYLGSEAKGLTLVCIPARQHLIAAEKEWRPSLPCLIKTHKQTNLRGYLSGRRSALLLKDGKLYRYKGCGNDLQGFIFQKNQLRGSHFFHTAKRQLYLTNLINKILEEQISIRSANKPLFWFQYPSFKPEWQLKNELKLVKKYCCVFETQGDRRVGTHVISPLEILFLNIFDHSKLELDKLFQAKQRKDEWGLTELLTDFEMSVEKGEKFLQKYDQRPQFSNYVNIREVSRHHKFKHAQNFSLIAKKIAEKFSKGSEERLGELLDRSKNWIDAFEPLLELIGWEMGQIKRLFCQKDINWGFFNDHGDWHCNAHLNNFVVAFPEAHNRFTLPLDFDLAFTKEEYINIDLNSQTYGEYDSDSFQQLQMMQYNAMEMSVSGVEIMNFRYSIEQAQQDPPLLIKMARIVFRDTLVRAFRWGMSNNRQEYYRICSDWEQNISQIQAIVESCLLISSDFQT